MVKHDAEAFVRSYKDCNTYKIRYKAGNAPPPTNVAHAEEDSHCNRDGDEECTYSLDEDYFWSVPVADCPADEVWVELASEGCFDEG